MLSIINNFDDKQTSVRVYFILKYRELMCVLNTSIFIALFHWWSLTNIDFLFYIIWPIHSTGNDKYYAHFKHFMEKNINCLLCVVFFIIIIHTIFTKKTWCIDAEINRIYYSICLNIIHVLNHFELDMFFERRCEWW